MRDREIKKKGSAGTARKTVPFRLSEYEIEVLEKSAKEQGLDRSKYIRQLILQGGTDRYRFAGG